MRLVSFDIFDTTLVRKTFSPNSIFQIVAAHLFDTNSAAYCSWITWREDRDVNMWKKKLYYTIEDIYHEFEVDTFCPYTSREMMEMELQVESNCLVANLQLREIIEDYRKKGYQIAFISDMYLTSKFLKRILVREGCYLEGDRIFVSCEEHARKSSGELFKKIKFELHPEEWIHYGDNDESDVRIPAKLGIKSIKVDTSKIGLERHIPDDDISAAIRTVRFQMGNTPLARLSAHYVATLYVPYVRWILNDALERNIRILYFLSRDAYILLRIAEALPHDGIELKYLFVSRKSLSSETERNNTIKYFEQEGLFNVESKAVVDVGWLGSTRKMINQILDNRNCQRVFFYYFSVWKDIYSKEYGDYIAYVKAPILNREITSFVEDFCSKCPYPTTIGYKNVGQGWIPLFPHNQSRQESQIVDSNVEACLRYSSLIDDLNITSESLYQGMETALSHLFSFNDSVDFSPLCNLLGCDGHPAVKKLTYKEIWIVATGGLVTLNDRVSLEVTLGLMNMKILWKLHNFFFKVLSKKNG